MSEFDSKDFNPFEHNETEQTAGCGDSPSDNPTVSNSSEEPYFNYLHQDEPKQDATVDASSFMSSSGEEPVISSETADTTAHEFHTESGTEESAAASEDSTYHYNYRGQNDSANQSDVIPSYNPQQTWQSQSSYQSQDGGSTGYSSQNSSGDAHLFYSSTDKEAKKRQKKMERASRKAARKSRGSKKGGYLAKIVASALVFGLVAGVGFQGFNYCYYKINPSAKASTSTVEATATLTTSGDTVQTATDYSEMVENVMPSIVSITSVVEQQISSGTWGYGFGYGQQGQTQEVTGAGSGIIISQNDTELLIATNYHVIEDTKQLTVSFCDSSDVSATVKGYDSDVDVAVVSVNLSDMEESTKSAIKIATLGSSSALKVGEPAIAIGNALGYGQSVTVGYVSAVDRTVNLTDKTLTLLQTDAAINPGNSGGALLNMKGEVIGINTAKYSTTSVEGMGFAIPIDTASPIIESLINQESSSEGEQAFLGITGTSVTDTYAQQLNFPTGIYVQTVQESSPAEQAGIYAGDIITKFDGTAVTSMQELSELMEQKKSGDQVTITISRRSQRGDFEEQNLTVTLGTKSDQ